MPTTRLRPLERQNERRLRTSYIFSADFFFLRINRSRKSDVFEIFSKKKTAARADLVGRYSVDQDLNLILGPRWRPGPKFNMDHMNPKPEMPLGVPRASRCYIYVVACVSSLSDPNPRGAKPELPLGVLRASRWNLCCGVCE